MKTLVSPPPPLSSLHVPGENITSELKMNKPLKNLLMSNYKIATQLFP